MCSLVFLCAEIPPYLLVQKHLYRILNMSGWPITLAQSATGRSGKLYFFQDFFLNTLYYKLYEKIILSMIKKYLPTTYDKWKRGSLTKGDISESHVVCHQLKCDIKKSGSFGGAHHKMGYTPPPPSQLWSN